jgi:hypothetical protein
MSQMSSHVLSLQEIIDPLVHMGATDQTIVEEVQKRYPALSESYILQLIGDSYFYNCG